MDNDVQVLLLCDGSFLYE